MDIIYIINMAKSTENRCKKKELFMAFIKELADKALITEIMLINIFQKRGGDPKLKKSIQ